jgi:hypothetical protein
VNVQFSGGAVAQPDARDAAERRGTCPQPGPLVVDAVSPPKVPAWSKHCLRGLLHRRGAEQRGCMQAPCIVWRIPDPLTRG